MIRAPFVSCLLASFIFFAGSITAQHLQAKALAALQKYPHERPLPWFPLRDPQIVATTLGLAHSASYEESISRALTNLEHLKKTIEALDRTQRPLPILEKLNHIYENYETIKNVCTIIERQSAGLDQSLTDKGLIRLVAQLRQSIQDNEENFLEFLHFTAQEFQLCEKKFIILKKNIQEKLDPIEFNTEAKLIDFISLAGYLQNLAKELHGYKPIMEHLKSILIMYQRTGRHSPTTICESTLTRIDQLQAFIKIARRKAATEIDELQKVYSRQCVEYSQKYKKLCASALLHLNKTLPTYEQLENTQAFLQDIHQNRIALDDRLASWRDNALLSKQTKHNMQSFCTTLIQLEHRLAQQLTLVDKNVWVDHFFSEQTICSEKPFIIVKDKDSYFIKDYKGNLCTLVEVVKDPASCSYLLEDYTNAVYKLATTDKDLPYFVDENETGYPIKFDTPICKECFRALKSNTSNHSSQVIRYLTYIFNCMKQEASLNGAASAQDPNQARDEKLPLPQKKYNRKK